MLFFDSFLNDDNIEIFGAGSYTINSDGVLVTSAASVNSGITIEIPGLTIGQDYNAIGIMTLGTALPVDNSWGTLMGTGNISYGYGNSTANVRKVARFTATTTTVYFSVFPRGVGKDVQLHSVSLASQDAVLPSGGGETPRFVSPYAVGAS